MIKKSGRERRGRRKKIETERGRGAKRELTVRERKMKKEGMTVGKRFVRGKEGTKEQKERRRGNRNREGEKTNAIVRGSRACIYVRAIVYVLIHISTWTRSHAYGLACLHDRNGVRNSSIYKVERSHALIF